MITRENSMRTKTATAAACTAVADVPVTIRHPVDHVDCGAKMPHPARVTGGSSRVVMVAMGGLSASGAARMAVAVTTDQVVAGEWAGSSAAGVISPAAGPDHERGAPQSLAHRRSRAWPEGRAVRPDPTGGRAGLFRPAPRLR